MGFRTVVMLSNDQASQWMNDPELGRKIMSAANMGRRDSRRNIDTYGSAVECVHADNQTLAVLDGYDFFAPLSGKSWQRGQSNDDVAIALLKEAAEKLGFRLVRKASKVAAPKLGEQEGGKTNE